MRAIGLALSIVAMVLANPAVVSAQECAERRDISLLLALDVSPSMDEVVPGLGITRLAAARAFAINVVDAVNDTRSLREAAVFSFCEAVPASPIPVWTTPGNVRANLAGPIATCAGTSLFNAIVFGANSTRSRDASNLRLFVLLSDGEDSTSRLTAPHATAADATAALSGGDIVARLVSIGTPGAAGDIQLTSIARGAGGKVQAIAARPADLSSLVGNIVDATCVNFRPTAAMSVSNPDLLLGIAGNSITFDGSPSTDRETPDSELTFEWTFTRPDGTTFARTGISVIESFTDAQLPHGETWTVQLRVTDRRGASGTSTTQRFRVIGSSPNIVLSGPSVDALQRLTVSARNTLGSRPLEDADGGPLEFQWRVVDAPPRGQFPIGHTWPAPPSEFSAEAHEISFDTTERDIGHWTFECTARDNEGNTDVERVTVEVRNLPPEIDLVGESEIDVGEPIHLETTITGDRDGGDLTFRWEILQAPFGGAPVGLYLHGVGAGASTIHIPTDFNSAGTWIFRLTATDDDSAPDSSLSEEFTVLVDAPPQAMISGPRTIGSLSFPLTLEGGDSRDPDSPCAERADRCHNTLDGEPVREISPPIVTYTWSLVDVPFEHWTAFPLGPVDEVLGVPAHGQNMTLEFRDLRSGDWTFRLEVRDGEGNEDSTTFTVTMVDENGPPIALPNAPARYIVSATGVLGEDIMLSGMQSFDPDNILSDGFLGPGSGITDYQWEIVGPPAGCAPPVFPSGSARHTVTLYAAGAIVDPTCHGFWRLRLTVTDDDSPARTGSAETAVIIGNCPQPLCIDYPTTLTPQFVEFTEDTDILIYYHLDSALYDTPDFTFGLYARLEIFHEGDMTRPVYTSYDPNVLASNRGSFLVFHWNGYTDTFHRPQPGFYTAQITLLNHALGVSSMSAREPKAIWLAVVEPRISPTSERYIDFNALDAGRRGPITIDYEIIGGAIPDELRWRVRDASDTVIFEGTELPGLSGTITWDGRIAGRTIRPGHYTVALEAYRTGVSLGRSERHAFGVHRLALTPRTGPVSDRPPGLFVFVNSDDDNHNNVSDLTEVAAGEDDLVEVAVAIEPSLEGRVTLSTGAASPPFKLWDTASKGIETALPATFNMPADALPARLFVEGRTPGQSDLRLQIQTPDGVTLGPSAIALTMVEVQVMTDTNNDHTIGAGDTATNHVRVARWDNAYDAAFNMRNNTDPNNFVEQDPSRFYVVIRDPSANADPAVAERITAQVSTLTGPGVVDDDPTLITLIESGINSGEFVSRSQVLTSRDIPVPDDDVPAHDGITAAVADDAAGDRTHRAEIDGTLRMQYQPSGAPAPKAWDVPVCNRSPEERRRLDIKVTVFNEPFQDIGYDHDGNPATPPVGAGNGIFDFSDTNGNSRHDAGEPSEPFLDLSSGATVFGNVGSRGGVVTQAQVNDQVQRANIAWAQACITVTLVSTQFANAPTSLLGNDILADGIFSTADTQVVVNVYAPGATVDVAEVFFVAPLPGANAVTQGPVDNIPTLGERTFTFIGPNLNISFRTLAHELGHALDNGFDNINPQTIFYPANNTFQDNAVNSYRRLIQGTVTNCRTTRPAGSLSATGNRLLKLP